MSGFKSQPQGTGFGGRSALDRDQFSSPHPPPGPYVVHGGTVMGHDQGDSFVQMRDPLSSGNEKETKQRAVGVGVGIARKFHESRKFNNIHVIAEHVLSHPCIVLRRQCQVHHDGQWYHTTPFTLFSVILNIHRHQSMTTLWKGIGSVFMVKALGVASETALSEVSPLPREVNRHTSLKKLAQHLLLKGVSIVITTPFYAASLVETVQSEIASERPGVLDCLREGGARLVGWSTPQTTRLLPVYRLLLPTLLHGLSHYVISSLAQYTVTVSIKTEMMEAKDGLAEETEPSMYEMFYPELLATFTGNLLADTVLFPLETILHRLCLQGTRTIIDNTDTGLGVMPIITRYEGALDCFHQILTQEGIAGLYKGFGALVLQYGLHIGILKLTKFILERVSQEMQLGARKRALDARQRRTPLASTPTGRIQHLAPRQL